MPLPVRGPILYFPLLKEKVNCRSSCWASLAATCSTMLLTEWSTWRRPPSTRRRLRPRRSRTIPKAIFREIRHRFSHRSLDRSHDHPRTSHRCGRGCHLEGRERQRGQPRAAQGPVRNGRVHNARQGSLQRTRRSLVKIVLIVFGVILTLIGLAFLADKWAHQYE